MKGCLVVVDMQNDFITGTLGSKEAQKIVPAVVDKIHNYSETVIFTKDTHNHKYLDTQEGEKLPVIHCIKETWGWELEENIRKIVEMKKCPVFEKPVFGSVELARFLQNEDQKQHIQQIELVGLCTDVCVISNALLLKSFLPETHICVNGTCCAGITVESHENALRAMKMCHIEIS